MNLFDFLNKYGKAIEANYSDDIAIIWNGKQVNKQYYLDYKNKSFDGIIEITNFPFYCHIRGDGKKIHEEILYNHTTKISINHEDADIYLILEYCFQPMALMVLVGFNNGVTYFTTINQYDCKVSVDIEGRVNIDDDIITFSSRYKGLYKEWVESLMTGKNLNI